MRFAVGIWLSLLAALLVVAASSYAEGAASIAAAPTITPGQQEFGSLSTHIEPPNYPDNCISWWLLPLTAGDSVQVLWEGQSSEDHLRLYPLRTTDFNYEPHGPRLIDSVLEGGVTKREANYEASETGNYPLDLIHAGNAGYGPYNFTVYVTHKLSIALPHLATLRHSGSLMVYVHNPEGGAIESSAVQVGVQIKGRGRWHTIGRADVALSSATIHYVVPRNLTHQHVVMRALAHGVGYKPAVSTHLKVRTL